MSLVVTFCLLYGKDDYRPAVYEYDNMTEKQAVSDALRKVHKAYTHARIGDYRVEKKRKLST